MRHAVLKLIALSVLLVLIPTFMCAQEVASVTGVVTDSTGAVVPGVQVTLVNPAKNLNYSATTNSSGAYTISRVLPGPGYKMTFKKDGFDVLVVNEIYVNVGVARTQNAELRIGKVSETVEVSATGEGVTLDTSTATVGTNLNMNVVSQLPTQLRDNPAALLTLQPGVVSATAGSDGLGSRYGAVTGARADQNNVTLDGLDVNDFGTGNAFAVVGNAPIDSIQEFHGETAGSVSAVGRGSGGQVQMVTKSGSNQFHGSLAEYNRNTALAANSFFNNMVGIKKAKLIRNQFDGSIGGPIVKDKLFFFFNYNGRRDAQDATTSRIVPLASFRAGKVGYIKNAPGCDESSRQNTTPSCIGYVSANPADNASGAILADFDPRGLGFNSALATYINGRYPEPNDFTLGDGINTAGYRFNAPRKLTENNYVSKIDYSLTDKMRLFGRFTIQRQDQGDAVNFSAPIQFPGDPLTHSIVDRSYQYVIGHTWTISSTKVNNFTYGETVAKYSFPTNYNPLGTTYWSSFGVLTNPYSNPSSQGRRVPIPVFKDDFTWQHGSHNIQIGGTFKPIRTTSALGNDHNFVSLGIGGNLSQLDTDFRPADILSDSQDYAISNWDSAYTFALGRFAQIQSNYNYDNSLSVLPQGSGAIRHYRYYEYEFYGQDTWKVNSSLTLTLGLRYQYYSVPYETSGIQAVQNLDFNTYVGQRIAQGQAGNGAYDAIDLLTYTLGGKANKGGPSLYESDLRNFAPRVAFSYNPNSGPGFLKKILGDKKTVIRGGAGVIYDHPVTSALNFIQDQNSYMFQASSTGKYGSLDPTSSLTNDPRFTAIGSIPTLPSAPTMSNPYTPYVDGGWPFGTASGEFNYAIDHKLKNPYSIVMTFGFQRELPHHFVLESTYVGRLGRRLIAQADASQLIDFKDPGSGQMMSAAFADLTQQLRNGANWHTVTSVPWFQGQIGPSGTRFAARYLGQMIQRGDIADAVQALQYYYWNYGPGYGLEPNVGLAGQFAGNTYITNKGSSNYHGWLTSLHKNLSNGLQFDFNYTFSHSIDNASGVANSIAASDGMGFICDVQNLRTCRGESDFDVKHMVSSNFVYDLPFGKGKTFGSGATGALNQVIGGWTVSGIPSWRTGIAFSAVTNDYLMGFANNAPPIFNGVRNALRVEVHKDASGKMQMFADPDAALASFTGPYGFTMGSRNNLRGPGFFNFDLAVRKKFPISERFNLLFSSEMFNAFNHANFGLPSGGGSGSGTDITSVQSFGQITASSAPRVIQLGLRLEF